MLTAFDKYRESKLNSLAFRCQSASKTLPSQSPFLTRCIIPHRYEFWIDLIFFCSSWSLDRNFTRDNNISSPQKIYALKSKHCFKDSSIQGYFNDCSIQGKSFVQFQVGPYRVRLQSKLICNF